MGDAEDFDADDFDSDEDLSDVDVEDLEPLTPPKGGRRGPPPKMDNVGKRKNKRK